MMNRVGLVSLLALLSAFLALPVFAQTAAPAEGPVSPTETRSVNLTWTAASGDPTGYLLEESRDGGDWFATHVVEAEPGSATGNTTFDVEGGVLYLWRVRATRGTETSDPGPASDPFRWDPLGTPGKPGVSLVMSLPSAP